VNILAFAVRWFDLSQPALNLFIVGHTTSANSLKTLQNGLKTRQIRKNTPGKQGKSFLFAKHSILGI